MFDFVQKMIEATKDLVCAYKPNLAFYENMGPEGISLLRIIVERIPDEIPVILDGKRGDISNTAQQYASALYDKLGADWVTLNPYMGYDSMRPFFEYRDKGVFVLCLTSNPGSKDFQLLNVDGKPLYRVVAEKVAYWNKDNNSGLVVGATHPEQLAEIREAAGDMPILIPGVGAQGGALEDAAVAGTAGFTKPGVINVSRSVLYASNGADFAQRAREELQKLNAKIRECRKSELAEETPDSPGAGQRDDRPGADASQQSGQPGGAQQQRPNHDNRNRDGRDLNRQGPGGNQRQDSHHQPQHEPSSGERPQSSQNQTGNSNSSRE
jgi:orotidine-5'-phosphate decarboxylase